MQSLIVLVFVLNIMAIQCGYHNYQRHQDSQLQRNIPSYKEGYQSDQSYVNTEEEGVQESKEDDTSSFEVLKGPFLIFPGGTTGSQLYPSMGTTRRTTLLETRPQDINTQSPTIKPSPQQIPLVPTTQSNNDIPSSTPVPPQTFTQKPTTNPSAQPESPMTSQSFPAFMNECVCTPFHSCYDNETSSNLTGVVDDRTNIPACQVTEKTCPNSNDICCCNLELPPSSTSSTQSQTQDSSPSEISTSNANCNCRPSTDCHDDVEIDRTLEKVNCKEPSYVCCYEYVLPESPSTPLLVTSTLSPEPQPQSSIPSELSHSANASECICTSFFKCYDPETSSNLTGLVNDRSLNQVTNKCLNNDICCHNLSPPFEVPETTTDCSGTCIPVKECHGLTITFEAAQDKNVEAIQKLRSLVCSQENGTVNVCCP